MRKPLIILIITITFSSLIIIVSASHIHAKVWALVSGTVKAEDGKPIEGAKVILVFEDGETHELITDKKGKWLKPNLRAGNWTIGFMADGYEPQNIKVRLYAVKDNEPIEIKLSRIPESPLKIGDELYKQKKYAEALQEYQRVLDKNPGLYQAYENIGICYYKLDDLDKAVEAFKCMLEKDPYSQESLINLSAIYFEKGNLEEGMKYFNQLNAERLTDPGVFYNVGILLFKNGQIDMAIEYLTRCITLDPNYVKGYYQLALANLNKGDMEEAKKNFQKVIELAPESEDASLARKLLEQIK